MEKSEKFPVTAVSFQYLDYFPCYKLGTPLSVMIPSVKFVWFHFPDELANFMYWWLLGLFLNYLLTNMCCILNCSKMNLTSRQLICFWSLKMMIDCWLLLTMHGHDGCKTNQHLSRDKSTLGLKDKSAPGQIGT